MVTCIVCFQTIFTMKWCSLSFRWFALVSKGSRSLHMDICTSSQSSPIDHTMRNSTHWTTPVATVRIPVRMSELHVIHNLLSELYYISIPNLNILSGQWPIRQFFRVHSTYPRRLNIHRLPRITERVGEGEVSFFFFFTSITCLGVEGDTQFRFFSFT